MLGEAFQRVWFAELFSVPASLWPKVFATGWFPFIELIGGPFEELFGFLDREIVYAWEEKVFTRFDDTRLHRMIDEWRSVAAIKDHLPFLERGVERYLAGDYLSAIGNVWPRIEGILRFLYSGPHEKPGQRSLLENMRTVLEAKAIVPETYLPSLFEDYLLTFFYRPFALEAGEPVALARHSHAHGVAAAESYDRKKALIAFLIVHQLFYYLKIGTTNDSAG